MEIFDSYSSIDSVIQERPNLPAYGAFLGRKFDMKERNKN
jgi:hypothetical protein